MTETLSHIAMRRLNGPEASEWYTPFPGVDTSLEPDGNLVIHAPAVNPDELPTNDLAKFDAQGRFRILGRRDNIVNTGGVKVQIEQVEAPCPMPNSANASCCWWKTPGRTTRSFRKPSPPCPRIGGPNRCSAFPNCPKRGQGNPTGRLHGNWRGNWRPLLEA